MAEEYTEMTDVGEIEGYQVFYLQGPQDAAVKLEPVDDEYVNAKQIQTEDKNETGLVEGCEKQSRQLQKKKSDSLGQEAAVKLDSPTKKGQMSVKNIVENLLQKNDTVLAQHDLKAFKPIQRTPRPKHATFFHKNILVPSGPTEECTTDDTPISQNDLIEGDVLPSDKNGLDSGIVCAVSSRVDLMSQAGNSLNADVTLYWCNFCSYKSDKKSDILLHALGHRFRCHKCAFQAFSRAAVMQHEVDDHEGLRVASLKFCALLPDVTKTQSAGKRKRTDNCHTEQIVKRECIENDDVAKHSSQDKVSFINAKDDCNLKITDVFSGPDAVNDLVHLPSKSSSDSSDSTTDSATTSKNTVAPAVTVSSALCWNCDYCDFVTLNQSFLKVHLNANHDKQPQKYIALLVSGKKEMDKIKASDAKHASNVVPYSSTMALTSTKQSLTTQLGVNAVRKNSTKPKAVNAVRKRDCKRELEAKLDNAEENLNKKVSWIIDRLITSPPSFKCGHCNFSSIDTLFVKTHLLQNHVGHVIYGLDMRAVRLKEKRYVLYCLKATCKFYTKETDKYLKHIDTCIGKIKDCPLAVLKSVELTKAFIEKSIIPDNEDRPHAAEYSCKYCSYKASNTLMKKHVLANHKGKNCYGLLTTSHSSGSTVYFCQHCAWETDNETALEVHITDKHSLSNEITSVTGSVPSSDICSDAADKHILSNEITSVTGSVPSSEICSDVADKTEPSIKQSENVETVSETGTIASKYSESCYTKLVPKEVHYDALSRFLEHKKSQLQPSGVAALKCKSRIKGEAITAITEGEVVRTANLPPLYSCLFCSCHEFGADLIRNHLLDNHFDKVPQAIDVGQLHEKDVFFCVVKNCTYTAQDPHTMLNHTRSCYTIPNQHLKRLLELCQNGTSSSSKGYWCLHCSIPKVFNDRLAMKTHFLAVHGSQVSTSSECIATKIGQGSKLYMCPKLICDFTTNRPHDYSLHVLGHQKAKIYECSRCQWFTAVRDEIVGHRRSLHNGRPVSCLEINLDIDKHDNIIRYVGGTLIK